MNSKNGVGMSAEPVVPPNNGAWSDERLASASDNEVLDLLMQLTWRVARGGTQGDEAIRIQHEIQRRLAVARAALPAPPDPAKFSERPFAEAVARVALLAMERIGMDLIGKYSREPVYPEAFVAAVADMWVRGRPKVGPALPAPEPPRTITVGTSTRTIAGGAALPAEHAPPDPRTEATCAFEQAYLGTMGLSPGFQMNHLAVRDGLEAAYAVDFSGSRPALAGSAETTATIVNRLTDEQIELLAGQEVCRGFNAGAWRSALIDVLER